MTTPVIVRASHHYQASAERVFDAWLHPAQASRFFFATRTGNILRCSIDPVAGGEFLVTDRRPHADGDESVFDAVHHGRYLVIDRPRLLVFDFSVMPFVEQPTRVTIDFRSAGPIACELALTHEISENAQAATCAEQTRKSWVAMLSTLERELFPRRVGVNSSPSARAC